MPVIVGFRIVIRVRLVLSYIYSIKILLFKWVFAFTTILRAGIKRKRKKNCTKDREYNITAVNVMSIYFCMLFIVSVPICAW